jgi:pyruvate kinase
MGESVPRFRRTKVVATLGPSSSDRETVRQLIEAGVSVMRINSAHGTREERAEMIGLVRQVRDEMGKHVAVLVDLQGPRIRVGTLPLPRRLDEGMEVVFATQETASDGDIPTTYESLARDVKHGSRILLDDGLLSVEVTGTTGDKVTGVVCDGGLLRSNKGINLPDDQVSAPAVTAKDRADVALALECGADLVGISFVSRAEDVNEVRSLVGSRMKLVAKIERATALGDIDRIVNAADAIMVARGDLGVELPFEEVPLIQKHLIEVATRRARPVITATQMLESMVNNPRPTRAEASDVANAILDGTDAVMLSAETAAGLYPVGSVKAMIRIINEIEQAILKDGIPWGRVSGAGRSTEACDVEDAIALAADAAAGMLRVPWILSITKSGFTARTIAANRPSTPVLGLTSDGQTCRYLALVWGVRPAQTDAEPTYDSMLAAARELMLEQGYVQLGDEIVVTAGDVAGTTNLMKVEAI